jgi:hypothetical protein
VGKLATVCSVSLDRSDLTTAIVPPDEELLVGASRNGSQVVAVAPELPPLEEELELLPPELDELEELELLPPLEDELVPPEELELLLEEELTPPEELELLLDELLELEELELLLDELLELEELELLLDELLELEELELLLDEPPEDELPLEPEPPLSSWWQALRRSATLRDMASGRTCDAVFI